MRYSVYYATVLRMLSSLFKEDISTGFQFLFVLDFYAVDSGAITWNKSTLQACSQKKRNMINDLLSATLCF